MRPAWLLAIAACACGRVGFEAVPGPDGAPADPDATTTADVAPHDAGADAIPVAICPNDLCEGLAGELCSVCPDDCATTSAVCGNSQCDPGESPACIADCGPSPWPWPVEEAGLFDRINFMRSTSHMCPDGTSYPAVAALAFDASLTAGSHEWAWEIVHTGFFPTPALGGCNGRTDLERLAAYGAGGYAWVGVATVDEAIAYFETNMTVCPLLMDAALTVAAGAFATEGGRPVFLVSVR